MSFPLSQAMGEAGFDIVPGEHPVIPVMLGAAKLAGEVAERLLAEGVYVIAFSYPVVPEGRARIRCQMSAALTLEDIDFTIGKFVTVKAQLGI
jgi:glycine C-acetyltransferase